MVNLIYVKNKRKCVTVWQYRVQVTTTQSYFQEPDIEAAFAKIREEHGCVVKSNEARIFTFHFFFFKFSTKFIPPDPHHCVHLHAGESDGPGERSETWACLQAGSGMQVMIDLNDLDWLLGDMILIYWRGLLWYKHVIVNPRPISFTLNKLENIQWVLFKVQSRWWMNSQWKHNFQRKLLNFLLFNFFFLQEPDHLPTEEQVLKV